MTHVEERLEPERAGISRRNVLRAGAVGAALVGAGAAKVVMQPSLHARGLLSRDGIFEGASIALADSLYDEDFPISPLILNPFRDPLLIPSAAKPLSPAEVAALPPPPGPGIGQQNSFRNETHQIWPDAIGFPDPIVYKFDLLVRQHSFTSSQVLPINSLGQPVEVVRRGRQHLPGRYGPHACRRRRSTGSTARSQDRRSTPSTAGRC